MPYTPTQTILDNYARVMVRFALGGGKGIKKGDVVYVTVDEAAKPLMFALQREILRAGGHMLLNYRPDQWQGVDFTRQFYELANKEQLSFFPHSFFKGLVGQIDHYLAIIGDVSPHALQGIDPEKIMLRGQAMNPVHELLDNKENAGQLSWSVCVYGTEGMAKEAGLSLKTYWQQIIAACFLDSDNPVKAWQQTQKTIKRTAHNLNGLLPDIAELHITGPDVDLWVTPGEQRQFVGATGRNIPSFEIYTSPDARRTRGWIRFDVPLYHYGNLVKGIELWFENGKVVKSKATENHNVLQEMIKTPGADRIGEFSLTDRRLSRITKFMATTIYDENRGGRYGNTHIALGRSYDNTYTGDPQKMKKKDWEKLGYNDSSVHTDMFSTSDRTVTAHLKDGKERVIYKDGEFVV